MQEKNEMIAEFMGGKTTTIMHTVKIDHGIYHVSKLRYHTSWDWLMPVVEKIERLEAIFVFPLMPMKHG